MYSNFKIDCKLALYIVEIMPKSEEIKHFYLAFL